MKRAHIKLPSTVLALAVTFIIIISTLPLFAANEPAPIPSSKDLTSLSIEDLMNVQVTTTSKTTETLSETPASVTVITSRDIERFGYRTLGDALKRVAGFYISTDRMYNYVGVRGYCRPGDLNTRILVLIDGHRLNESLYDYAGVGYDFPLDMENVDRIEVVKGPGSALWGTNAMLGIVNVITKKGYEAEKLNINQNSGSDSSNRTYIGYGSKIGNDLHVTGSYSNYDSAGQRVIQFPYWNEPQYNNGVVVGCDAESAENKYFNASYNGLSLMLASVRRQKDIPSGYSKTALNVPGSFLVDRRSFIELNYTANAVPSHNGKLFLRTYGDSYNYYRLRIIRNTLEHRAENHFDRLSGSEIRYSQDVSPSLSLVGGAEYFRLRSCDYGSFYHATSLYMQADSRLSRRIQLIAGTRLDKYSNCGNNLSPRLAAIYHTSPGSSVKLLYGRALRIPNGYERYESYDDPNLKPEKITTQEIVWEQKIANRHRLSVSFYKYRFKSIIDEYDFINMAAVNSKGIDIQLESQLGHETTAYLGWSLIDAHDSATNQWIDNSPKHLLTAGVSVPILHGKYYLSPEIHYIGKRIDSYNLPVSPSTDVDLAVISSGFGDWNLSLRVNNLFNKSIIHPVYGYVEAVPDDWRTIEAQLSYSM